MCQYGNDDDHSQPADNTCIYSGSSNLFRKHISRAADKLKQRRYRNLVTGIEQYRYDNLYFYAVRRAMCQYGNDDDHS
ncbi:hypothetical protein HYN48_04580 [Flavobacterium magnum]|uniref:Uncharacterized protein n=1 Tax=Flavobacterium magnum TaxID=2162713 RepID=A0A2S0RD02_9FLAO|nr:hypothetical protein HYN48_04580 [Flavobacterium magnum]